MSARIRIAAVLAAVLSYAAVAQEVPAAPAKPAGHTAAASLIPWLLQEGDELHAIPFSDVIRAATGKEVRAIDRADATDVRVLKQIGEGLDEVLRRMNAPDAIVQSVARINEVSSAFEETMREVMNTAPGLSCDFPKTANERVQRSGYPDLRLVDTATKRVYYMDPKLYAEGSRTSSFRTFYFEPKVATNKVRDDATHLILGIEHAPRKAGHWEFTRWDIVDLAHFTVKLKAEFQGSNRDMYRPDAIVGSSAK
ncbi:MAG: hypothetical protein M3Y69_02495 [Verrucomicrobiota bacterium]|nr:hypothetical protein [Verrucomicrobiota bacterium]